MMRQDLIDAFSQIVGANHVLTANDTLLEYSYDKDPGFSRLPDAIIEPADTAEVSRVLALANAEKIPVYPRGYGSNLYNAITPVEGGIILLLRRMNSLLEIDTANLAATVEPGIFVADLNKEVQKFGLIFPPDPGTIFTATIGGMVAQNATNIRSLKYGSTKHYIMGLEVVLADGKILKTGGKNVKDVAGYDLTKLMTGSQGTLGIITKVIVKLMPAPETQKCLLAGFKTFVDAGKAVKAILDDKIVPATLEFMDSVTIQALGSKAPSSLPPDIKAALIIEIDGITKVVENDMAKISAILQAHNVQQVTVAETEIEQDAFWNARRAAITSLAKSNDIMWMTDAIIPRSKAADMVDKITSIASKNKLTIAAFGHIGDGVLHPTILFNASDKSLISHASNAMKEISAAARELGGIFCSRFQEDRSGQPETYAKQALKFSLDPNNILNPVNRVKEG